MKDKKKKKKQAWLDDDIPSAEGSPGFATPEEVLPATDEAGTEQPPATSEQQSEATPDDEWGGFSLKKSKKDKKKKKAKDVESETPQEPEIASPYEPKPDKTEFAEFSPDPTEDAPLDAPEPVSTTEPEILGEIGSTADAVMFEELDKKQQDDWSLGLSKKDKKKKKKAKTLELEADEGSSPSEGATMSRDSEVAEEAVEEDMWSSAPSKKDKKKNKKAKLDSRDDYLTETVSPVEDAMNMQKSTTTIEAERKAAVDTAATLEPQHDLEEEDSLALDAPGTTHDQSIADDVESPFTDIPAAESKEPEAQPKQEHVGTEVSDDWKQVQGPPTEQSADAETSTSKDSPPDDEWSVPLVSKKGKEG